MTDTNLALLRSLRRAGDEPQLTRAIGELAQADAVFARGLLETLVRAAPRGRQVMNRLDNDQAVECNIERMLYADGDVKGRIELVLGHERLRLFIEVKLYSDYRQNQLFDYLEAIEPHRGECLISVTRNVSRFREPPDDAPGWLGSVRWARLGPDLRNLPSPGPIREQWNLLLELLEEDGELGSIKLTRELISAYERADEATSTLSDFLEQIAHDALHRVRSELSGGSADRSAASFRTLRRNKKLTSKRGRVDVDEDAPEVLWDEDGRPYLACQIPAGGSERLWTGFYIDDDGHACFYIAAGWSDDHDPPPRWERSWRIASEHLRRELPDRRLVCNENEDLYVQIDYPLVELAGADDVPQSLAALIDEDIPRMVTAGLFAGDLATHQRRHS